MDGCKRCEDLERLAFRLLQERDAFRDAVAWPEGGGSLRMIREKALEAVEKAVITEALKQTKGNQLKASRLLRVSYKTLLNKVRGYDIFLS